MIISHQGELAALATAFFWTITALAFEAAGKRIGSLAVNLIRLCIGFLFLTVFCAIWRGMPLPLDASNHNWYWLLLSGVVGFTIGDLSLFRSFLLIGARISMLIMALVPPMTALIGYAFLGEELTLTHWIGMTLTIGGVAWVVLERKPGENGGRLAFPLSGLALGVLAALGQSVQLVISKHGMQGYDPFNATQIRVLGGIAGFALMFTAIRWWPKVFGAFKDGRAMALTTLGAFFGPFLGVSFSLISVVYTESGIAATIMALVPVLIIPPAILINKEKVHMRAILGALTAVVGVGLLFL